MKDFWICPNCDKKIHEIYLKCDCGYLMTREKISRQAEERKILERKNTEQLLLRQQQCKHELARASAKREQLASLKKRKEDCGVALKKRLAESKELFDSAVLTQQEHDDRRKAILATHFEEVEKLSREIEEGEKELSSQCTEEPTKKPESTERITSKTNVDPVATVDPSPHISSDVVSQSTQAKSRKTEGGKNGLAWSWKTFLVAILLAAVLNVVGAAATGTKPMKNIYWTAMWIYLSITSWKYWGWKALLPYPCYFVLLTAIGMMLVAAGVEVGSWPLIIVMGVANIGGLVIFSVLLNNTAKRGRVQLMSGPR